MNKITFTTLLFLTFLIPASINAQEPGSGYALNFDGIDDKATANAGDLSTYTNDFTIELWVRSTTTRTTKAESTTGITGTTGNGQKYVVYPTHGGGSNAGVGISIGTNGVSVYEHGAGYMPALLVYDVSLTGWNHIAVVYSSKQPSLYINGILVRTGLTSVRTACFPSAQIGGDTYGYHQGDVDEFRIWSVSRSQSEIRDNMCKKLTGAEANLRRYLRFDDNTGLTVTDETGNQNATMINMVAASDWITSAAPIGNTSVHAYPSFAGTALDFDGSNDYVNGYAADLTTITDNFTMEMWVKPTGTITIHPEQNCLTCVSGTGTPNQRLAIYPQHGGGAPGPAGAGISIGTNGIQVYEHASGYMPALASYSGTISGWNHIAVVYTAKQPRIYLNGVLVRTGLTSLTANVFPGAHIGGVIYGHYLGQIDDVRIWNFSRTPAQINSDMCSELTGGEAGLVRYYNFNDAAGFTATDGTGTKNGPLTNMTAGDWVTTGAGSCMTGTLTHTSPELDELSVNAFSGMTQGVHLYHVDAIPNTTAGISGLGDNDHYYGVFKAGEKTATSYTATYTYTENDAFQASFPTIDENDLVLYTRSDNSITPWTNSGAAVNTVANTLTATAVSTEFIIGIINGSALPVELLEFEGHLIDQEVALNWITSTEIDNDYFIVQRSADGFNWNEIARVDGAGNSSIELSYNHIDHSALDGISYYRLKQVDFDGQIAFSKAIAINKLANKPSVSVYPNPASQNEGFNLEFKGIEGVVSLTIYDAKGKLVYLSNLNTKQSKGNYQLRINAQLPPGLYAVQANSETLSICSKLIVK